MASVTLQQHHPHGSVSLRLVQRIGHGRVHGGGDGILFVNAVQRDGGDTGFGVDEDVAHGESPNSNKTVGI